MQHEEFLGKVQQRARLRSREEAGTAVQATLSTLAQRLAGGAAGNLASQLAPETARFMNDVEFAEAFTLDEFFRRVSRAEGVDLPQSIHHARAVVDVLRDAVDAGTLSNVRAQLPDTWTPLFQAGSEGDLRLHDR